MRLLRIWVVSRMSRLHIGDCSRWLEALARRDLLVRWDCRVRLDMREQLARLDLLDLLVRPDRKDLRVRQVRLVRRVCRGSTGSTV